MSDPYLTCRYCGVVESNKTLLEFKHQNCAAQLREVLELRKELDPDAPDEIVMRCEDEKGLKASTCKRCGARCFGFLCAECLR